MRLNKKLFIIFLSIMLIFTVKCYAVDISNNVMYEYKNGQVQTVLYTSCAASSHSIDRYKKAMQDNNIPDDEYGYYWADLEMTPPENTSYYTIKGLLFHNEKNTKYIDVGQKNDDGKVIFNDSEFDVASNEKWWHIYYDSFESPYLLDPARRDSTKDGDITVKGVKSLLFQKYTEAEVKKNSLFVNTSSDKTNGTVLSGKYLIDKYKNKIICKYYVTNIEKIIPEGESKYWSTVVSIKLSAGHVSEAHDVYTAYQLFYDIYGNDSNATTGKIDWSKGSKGIINGTATFEDGQSAANDFDNILHNDPNEEANLQVRYFIKTGNGSDDYEMIPLDELDNVEGNVDSGENTQYTIKLGNVNSDVNPPYTIKSKNSYDKPYFFQNSWILYGIVPDGSHGNINNATNNTIWTIENKVDTLNYGNRKYSYKFSRFGYDNGTYGAAELNLSEKKGKSFEFCGGAEYSVVNFYYDPEEVEEQSHYWYAYVEIDENGSDSSILYKSPKSLLTKEGVTVPGMKIKNTDYYFANMYQITGKRGSTFNSLYKKYKNKESYTTDVNGIRGPDSNPDPYTISDRGEDILIIIRYKRKQNRFFLGVRRALSNGTLLAFNIDNDKREVVTNVKEKTEDHILLENAKNRYELDILKGTSNVTNEIIKYKNGNAMYKYNGKYYLKYENSFDYFNCRLSIKSIYQTLPKKDDGSIDVKIKNDGIKKGAELTYFYDKFPKRTVYVYRKYKYTTKDKDGNTVNKEVVLSSTKNKYENYGFYSFSEEENSQKATGEFYLGYDNEDKYVANKLRYITKNEKDIYEYNGDYKLTYYNNERNPRITVSGQLQNINSKVYINQGNLKNNKYAILIFYYTKKPDPEWITVCPKLNFKTVADYLKNAEGKENVATNTCKEKDKTYECTDNDTTTQELVVPIGEDIKPIVNVPKVILIDSLSYSYDNTRGGIWQEVSVKNGKYNLRVVGYKALVLTEVKIKQNDGSNFVSLLSEDKVVYSRSNMANNSILSTELVNSNLGKNIGEALSKKFEYSGSSRSDYENHVYKYATSLTEINNYITNEIAGSNVIIDNDAYNGVKSAYATVKYKAVNIGITDFSYYSNISPYLKEGSSSSVLGGDNSNNESGDYERTTKDSVKKKEYSTNSSYVNVYEPLSLSIDVKGINTVDHTTGKDNSTLIQNNAKLKVTAMIRPLTSYTKMSIQHIKDKYLGAYYYKFGFKVDYNGKTYESGSWIRGGESIEVLVNDSRLDNDNNTTTSVVSDYMNEIVCMAVTKNIPSYKNEDLTTIYDHYSSSNEITIPIDCKDSNEITTNNEWSETLKSNNKVKQDAYYAVKATKRIASIGRIYDFRITDCTDVDFKSVFRKSGQGVNSLTGTVYFSGIKELQIFGNGVNSLEMRKDPKTLPLGPYKHTNSNYVDAPKMGYRISFDVKTTGKYVTTSKAANELNSKYKKYVKITPSYYYIKKDGTGYNENITLYYKNASNKYVKFIGSGFKISYKPNDGYRNVTNLGITNITDMFTDKYVTLEVSNKDGFNLNIESMCTNYSGYVQSWYGEFKLPNTTIAVADGGSVTNPLTDGYIGVKFDIKCIYIYDTQTTEVSYNTPNKNASGTNTTQWDYEGYLGFKNAGKDVTENDGLYLQFPKGKLMISSQEIYEKSKGKTQVSAQDMYEKIRGTVVFFDLDNRASNDFE